MTSALVIGNGESRRHIDLEIFKKDHTLIGCNAIHRNIDVDHLICCDKRMIDEALKNNVQSTIYIREDRISLFPQLEIVPQLPYQGETKKDQPEHWGSGPYAVLLAAILGFKNIKLLGFDLYPLDNKVNNIYKDTPNYSKSDAKPVDSSFWIYQISKIFEYYPNSIFMILNHKDWQLPSQWILPNVKFQPFNG